MGKQVVCDPNVLQGLSTAPPGQTPLASHRIVQQELNDQAASTRDAFKQVVAAIQNYDAGQVAANKVLEAATADIQTKDVVLLLVKLQDDMDQMQRAHANQIVGLTTQWEQRFKSFEQEQTVRANQWEQRFQLLEGAMRNGLHEAKGAAANIRDRANKFTQLGEAMERSLSWVDQSDRRCVQIEHKLDDLCSDFERLARLLLASGALPKNEEQSSTRNAGAGAQEDEIDTTLSPGKFPRPNPSEEANCSASTSDPFRLANEGGDFQQAHTSPAGADIAPELAPQGFPSFGRLHGSETESHSRSDMRPGKLSEIL